MKIVESAMKREISRYKVSLLIDHRHLPGVNDLRESNPEVEIQTEKVNGRIYVHIYGKAEDVMNAEIDLIAGIKEKILER